MPFQKKPTTVATPIKARWSTEDIIKLLNLLKRYPVLYDKMIQGPNLVEMKKSAMDKLLDACKRAKLELRDVVTLRKKIDNIKASFNSTLANYKKQANRRIKNPIVPLQWFPYAEFLDTLGFIQKHREKMKIAAGKKKSKAMPKPMTSFKTPSTRASTSDIKVEVNYNEEFDDEESETEIETEDYEEEDEADYSQDISHNQSVAIEDLSQDHVPNHPHQPVQAQRQHNYFTAFLEYAYLRSRNYSGRQKREIINALSNVMNHIDEENEMDTSNSQNYSIQILNSLQDQKEQP